MKLNFGAYTCILLDLSLAAHFTLVLNCLRNAILEFSLLLYPSIFLSIITVIQYDITLKNVQAFSYTVLLLKDFFFLEPFYKISFVIFSVKFIFYIIYINIHKESQNCISVVIKLKTSNACWRNIPRTKAYY